MSKAAASLDVIQGDLGSPLVGFTIRPVQVALGNQSIDTMNDHEKREEELSIRLSLAQAWVHFWQLAFDALLHYGVNFRETKEYKDTRKICSLEYRLLRNIFSWLPPINPTDSSANIPPYACGLTWKISIKITGEPAT